MLKKNYETFLSKNRKIHLITHPKNYKPKKIARAFKERYIHYKNKGDKRLSMEQYLQEMKPLLTILENLVNGKFS